MRPVFVLFVACAVVLSGCAGRGPQDVGDGPGWTAPASPFLCPPAGVRIEVGGGDAAMGLRVLSLMLVNCGTAPYEVDDYPAVRPLDDERQLLDVQVLHGAKGITISLPHLDEPPRPLTLKPGESAAAGIIWRNTYDDITNPPVTVPFLDVAPQAGRSTEILPIDAPLDLGSTGKLGVSAWEPWSDPDAAAPDRDPAPSLSPSVSSSPSPDVPLL